jgi:signal transduction histidine kinase
VPRVAVVPPVRRVSAASSEERLQLLEFFLATNDVVECAERAVEWLVTHAGVQHALCAAVDAGNANIVGLACHGLRGFSLPDFRVELEQRGHPLVAVLTRLQPAVIPANGHADELGIPAVPYLAVPLHGPVVDEEPRLGVLLVGPVLPRIVREARWVADVLGPRIAHLRAYRGYAESQRRLDRDRNLLQAVIDAVSDPILLTDTEGRMVIANSAAERLFAAKERESEGRQRAVALNNMLFSAALSWSATSPEPLRRELLLVDPNEGSDLLFELISAVVTDTTHGTGLVSILRNVTDLRRATEEIEENYRLLRATEAEMRVERDRLNLIIDSVADPILVTDVGGAIIMMNDPAERLFTPPKGATEESVLRVGANDAHFSSFVANLLFAGETMRYRGDISLTDPNTGRTNPFEAVAGKILSEHGELIGVVTILHDKAEALERERLYEQLKEASSELEEKVAQATAELVRQNELLRRQHIQLEQASALKSQFLANMSHEFRTPLNAILGYTSMLLQGVSGGEMTAPQRRNLSRVDSNARHLMALVNDILDISRIEAGKMPLHASEFKVAELIGEVMAEVEPIIARTRLKVMTDVAPAAGKVYADRQKVKQIVLNLLSNALKFTPDGSVSVVARYRASADEICIAVVDTGIGIAPADQEKVFEDFQQADTSTTRQYSGAGLGLSICRRLADMMDGRITLQSQVGKGSTFTLVLPRHARRGR